MASNNDFQKGVGLPRQIIKTVKKTIFAKHLDKRTNYSMCFPKTICPLKSGEKII
jgi:hypothetical protein